MRLPHDTFIALGTALPGTVIGSEDARPVLPPVIHKALSIPGIVLPTIDPPTGTKTGSTYFSGLRSQNESTGAVSIGLIVLSSGLWRISGGFALASTFTDLFEFDSLSFLQASLRNVFTGSFRTTDIQNLSFDFNALFRETATIELNFTATGAGEFVNASFSLLCERLL